MADTIQPSTTAQPAAAWPHANAAGVRDEIGKKWPKFSAREITTLKSKDDLVALIQSKYQLEKSQAHCDVNAFAKRRQC